MFDYATHFLRDLAVVNNSVELSPPLGSLTERFAKTELKN